jgi:2-keto-4-pentenoate hydratase
MLLAALSWDAAMSATIDHAGLLLHAYTTRQPLLVGPDSGPASVQEAYSVQQAVWRRMTDAARPTAWKVGAPNRQAEPTAAAVFPQRLVHCVATQPAVFSIEDFRTLGIEAEIALSFGRDLPARSEAYRPEEIRAAIASAHVAMELVDTRLADPEAAGPLWRLADNLLNGALVVGEAILNWHDLDFSGLKVRALANHRCLAESVGRQPLDDLFYCLPWWLARNGGAKAGDIVTTGAWNGMHPVNLPAEVTVEFVGVGSVSARIA